MPHEKLVNDKKWQRIVQDKESDWSGVICSCIGSYVNSEMRDTSIGAYQ